jgi:Holliday junction resolvase RusA-like endonuclease
MELQLPFPPSVNQYWRNFRGRTIISKAGRDYRAEVWSTLAGGSDGKPRLSAACIVDGWLFRLIVAAEIWTISQSQFDSRTHAQIYLDDHQ